MKKNFLFTSITCFILLSVGSVNAYVGEPLNRQISGKVYADLNHNGKMEIWEPGIAHVPVSNGKEVVLTNRFGEYSLPAYDEMVVMISQPSGYQAPLNELNIPRFFYVHSPKGSPQEIKKFKGLDPTGPLPKGIDFPLYPAGNSSWFKAIMIGDTQPYDDNEVSYVRDTVVKEITADNCDASFAISMGDNIGDYLDLYPRYLKIMSQLDMPLYLVPGNHDVNYDANDPAHAFETFKREFGPTYYSFNYGKVHFVVLNSVYYPSPVYSTAGSKTYHGEIDACQMEWLKNDLACVPMNYQIVLSMHIPVVSYSDRTAAQHKVANREELYALLAGRKAVTLGGHTHTLENFIPGDEESGWGQASPIRQIIVGAACGSWWSGDLDDNGIPYAYQRDGSPRGYMLFDFTPGDFAAVFKATGKDKGKQMSLSFWTPSFENWANLLQTWANENSATRSQEPPVKLSDLPDQKTVKVSELPGLKLVINAWNAASNSKIIVKIDGKYNVTAVQDKEISDPHALRNQLYVLRYTEGFRMYRTSSFGPAPSQPLNSSLHVKSSSHIFSCDLPEQLKPGTHTLLVTFQDEENNKCYRESLVFEVVTD